MELEHGSHCVFCLNYHLALVIKYRKKVINDKVSDRLKEIFKGVGESYNISIKEWNHDIDYVHVLFTSIGGATIEVIKRYIENQGL